MYSQQFSIKGFRFQQEMDLTTDVATYRDMEGKLLMTVDQGGNCTDGNGEPFGEFKLNWEAGPLKDTWRYVGEDCAVIETGEKLLFDKAEPKVIAQLFGNR